MNMKKANGFLAKRNPQATLWTVLRSIGLSCFASSALWGLAIVFKFNPKFQASWVSFTLLMICAALVGAVYEWQVPKE
jgi:hypothetical protein